MSYDLIILLDATMRILRIGDNKGVDGREGGLGVALWGARQDEARGQMRGGVGEDGEGLPREGRALSLEEGADARGVVVDGGDAAAAGLDDSSCGLAGAGDVQVELGLEPQGSCRAQLDAVLGHSGEEARVIEGLHGDGLGRVDEAAVDQRLNLAEVDGAQGPAVGLVGEAGLLHPFVQRRLASLEPGAWLLRPLPLSFHAPPARLALRGALPPAP